MSLEPLDTASPVIQIHAWAAIFALVLGVGVLWRRKGTPSHRWSGRVWLVAMLVTVLSSFFIHQLRTWGPWSPIHILSLVTLYLMVRAYVAIRRRKIVLHSELMKATYYNALLLATFFTFMPGRIMHEVVFGASPASSAYQVVPLWVWIVGGVIVVFGARYFASRLGRRRQVSG
jgi:uncharacterized membrane protein